MVPSELRAEAEHGDVGDDAEGDDLLHDFELNRCEVLLPHAICGNLRAVFEKGDAPADEDDLPERILAVFQVTVPGDGHADV